MADYELLINIWNLEDVFNQGLVIFYAFGVARTEDGQPEYNVVAKGRGPAQRVPLRWKDSYAFSGGPAKEFKQGNDIDTQRTDEHKRRDLAELVDISLGQTYKLYSATDGSVASDTNAPKKGFHVNNRATDVDAVLYKEVGGDKLPIYLVRGPGIEQTLYPKPSSIAVWLAREDDGYASASMMEGLPSNAYVVEMKSNRQTVAYDGRWRAENAMMMDPEGGRTGHRWP